MNTTYDLSKFFATATVTERTAVLLYICEHDESVLVRAIEAAKAPVTWYVKAEELLRAQKKIEAIKVCREHTGWSLRDAKDAVESLQKELGL